MRENFDSNYNFDRDFGEKSEQEEVLEHLMGDKFLARLEGYKEDEIEKRNFLKKLHREKRREKRLKNQKVIEYQDVLFLIPQFFSSFLEFLKKENLLKDEKDFDNLSRARRIGLVNKAFNLMLKKNKLSQDKWNKLTQEEKLKIVDEFLK